MPDFPSWMQPAALCGTLLTAAVLVSFAYGMDSFLSFSFWSMTPISFFSPTSFFSQATALATAFLLWLSWVMPPLALLILLGFWAWVFWVYNAAG